MLGIGENALRERAILKNFIRIYEIKKMSLSLVSWVWANAFMKVIETYNQIIN